jgi:glucokinase
MDVVLGVDVGGTKSRAVLLGPDQPDRGGLADPPDLTVVAMDEVPTATSERADPGLGASHALAHRLRDRALEQGLHITGVGIGVPEYVRGGLLHSDLVLAWTVQPGELFADIAPVTVESDVRCGALAETVLGAGRDSTSMLYASIGTGISSSFVVGGHVWEGHRGEAIALGELPIDRDLDPGVAHTLEEFASGSAIARRYSRATGQQVAGAREVLALAEGHDPRARAIVESAASAIGAALAWAVYLVDPQVVVLGGGLGSSGGWWTQQINERYQRLSRPSPPPLLPAECGADSGAIGAALASFADLGLLD